MRTKKPCLRSSRGKPPQRPKSCRKRWMIVLKSLLRRKPLDRNGRRVRSRMGRCITNRSQNLTNQPQRAVPVEFSRRSYTHRGPMARPGPRRSRIDITDAPGMRIGARTVTPATVVPLGTRRNGDDHPITTAVTIDMGHHPQDVPVTEVGKGIQRQGRQLLPTLVTTIQRDSRGRHGGLVLRTGIAVQWPSRQPLPCQGARTPAVLTCLVIRDRHSKRVNGIAVVQRIIRYLRLHSHARVRPHIDLDHPAVVRYILCTCLRSLQSQLLQQTWRHRRMAQQRLPTWYSLPTR